MVYRHPLAFLVGLEGAALLRAHAGDGGPLASQWCAAAADAAYEATPAAIIWHFQRG